MDTFQSLQSSLAALISSSPTITNNTTASFSTTTGESTTNTAPNEPATPTSPFITTTMSFQSAAQSTKDLQKSVKETLKTYETTYKTTIREAEKKCDKIRKEADKEFEREKAIIKGHRDAKEKAAKEEFGIVKQEAKDLHTHLVLETVRNAILDLKTRNLVGGPGVLGRSNSVVSTNSATGTAGMTPAQAAAAAAAKEEAEVKEWVEIAAEKLEMHMSRTVVRQRVLEEVASGALLRQYQAQQEADLRTQDLQRQIEHLQMLQQQHQQQQSLQGVAPPAYGPPVGISESDYSQLYDSKKP
ncbi:hypothetical protein K457DRAFT_138948 [Linnemannia elongata AG-77]|uniref:Uncharacterized protein n=1 Tax=Linnemannia elongata AG-77 TaxID=1314771 RepID=A0A197JUT3_9FUNG|nr:hypothetical protein K457DRAFT_138948 [Linnemannia elongata AG-77]